MANNYTETTRSHGKNRIYDWMLNHTTKRNQEHDRKTAFYTLSASSVEHEKKMLPHCNYVESWNTSKKHTNQNHELLCDIENKEDISLTAVRGDINHERGLNPLIEKGSLSTFFYDYCGLHKCIDGFKEACQNQKDLHERGAVTAFYVTFTISGRSKDGSSKMKELSKEVFGIDESDDVKRSLPKVFEGVKQIGEDYSGGAKLTDGAYYRNGPAIVLTVLFEHKKFARSIKARQLKDFSDRSKLSAQRTKSFKDSTFNKLEEQMREEQKKVVFAMIYDLAKQGGITATEMSKAFRSPQAIAHHAPGFRKKLKRFDHAK